MFSGMEYIFGYEFERFFSYGEDMWVYGFYVLFVVYLYEFIVVDG